MKYKKPRPRERNHTRPAMRLLLAGSDQDPSAMMIDFTPVDLSGKSCCPFCGSKIDNPERLASSQ